MDKKYSVEEIKEHLQRKYPNVENHEMFDTFCYGAPKRKHEKFFGVEAFRSFIGWTKRLAIIAKKENSMMCETEITYKKIYDLCREAPAVSHNTENEKEMSETITNIMMALEEKFKSDFVHEEALDES